MTRFASSWSNTRMKCSAPGPAIKRCSRRSKANWYASTRRCCETLRDKVNRLAHSVADALATMDDVEFIEDPNTIRMEARRILEELLVAEEKIDLAARQKIESQKRTITEGTQEWDILYRKYYNEEVKKLGI